MKERQTRVVNLQRTGVLPGALLGCHDSLAAQPVASSKPNIVIILTDDLRPGHWLTSVAVFSPWTALALTGASFIDPKTHDPVFQPEVLAALAQSCQNGADPREPPASPLYRVPPLLPPILIQVGTDELLLDDAKRYAETAAHQGSEVKLELFEGLHHVFQRDVGSLAIADQALDQTARFVTNRWNNPTVPRAGKEFK